MDEWKLTHWAGNWGTTGELRKDQNLPCEVYEVALRGDETMCRKTIG